MVMKGDSVESDISEQNSEVCFETLDQIEEKASSIFDFSLQFVDVSESLEKEEEERLRVVEAREKKLCSLEDSVSRRASVLEEKEIEFDLRQVIEATIVMMVLEKQSEEAENNKLGLLLDSTTKELEDMMSEFEGKKEEARQMSEFILEKLSELEKAKLDFDLKQKDETERQKKESEAKEKELKAVEEAITEKTAELKRKEETFELKVKEEADKLREESELRRIKEKKLEKMLKEIELKQMKLEDRSKQQLIEAESRKLSNLESEAREKKLNSLEEAIKEKTAELKRKEETFELKLKEEADKLREEADKLREETELRRNGLEIKEKALGKLLKEVELKQKELEERSKQQLIEAESLKRSNLESEARETKLNSLEEAIKEKTAELERKEETFELKQKEEADKLREETELRRNGLEIKEKALEKKLREVELKQMDLEEKSKQQLIDAESRKRSNLESEAREKELKALEEAIKEKTAELKRKEETFKLKLKEEADKLREENELKRKGLGMKEEPLELDLQQMELKERSKQQLVEAESRKRSNLELGPSLLAKSDSDDAASLTRQAKKQKSQEASDGDIEEIVCTDKSYEDSKLLTCADTRIHDFSKSMSSFAVDQVWALYDPRDDMPRIYAQVRRIFDSQLSLEVTLLEHVKTTKDEKAILSGCGRFEYGDTEIKNHLMFVHEMDHIVCANNVTVNPRKGETWALFRDWNASWNSHPDLHEPPYRYDYVEVISDFDDLSGIAVAYMGRVEGFISVFNRAEQHDGLVKNIVPPGEMQKFSHKVASVKLSGDEKEGIPAGSFELNPAATPSYDSVSEEVVEMKIESKGCGKALTVVHENRSTKDLPIIID